MFLSATNAGKRVKKMKEYQIDGSEITYFSATVEAENEDEAKKKVRELWAQGQVNFADRELGSLEVWK